MAQGEREYGEGNYKASREYNKATKKFVESGRVDDAARAAAPEDAREAADLEHAEAEGRRRAKEEDPAIRRGGDDVAANGDPHGRRVTDRPADETTIPAPGQEGN